MAASFRALVYAACAKEGELMASQAKPTEEMIGQLLHGGRELQPPKNAKQERRLKDFASLRSGLTSISFPGNSNDPSDNPNCDGWDEYVHRHREYEVEY